MVISSHEPGPETRVQRLLHPFEFSGIIKYSIINARAATIVGGIQDPAETTQGLLWDDKGWIKYQRTPGKRAMPGGAREWA